MKTIWTIDGDETSWSAWAESMAQAPASTLVQDLIATRQASDQDWALDVGCGTGRAFIPLAEAGYRVIGIDPTARGLRFGRQRIGQSQIFAFPVQASAARLPVKTDSISFVFAIGTLFHISLTELASALKEIRRVLQPDGEALLHFLDVEDWRRSLAKEIRPEQAPVPSYQAVVTCFCSHNAIQQWIDEAGLNLISLELRKTVTEAGQQRNWLARCVR